MPEKIRIRGYREGKSAYPRADFPDLRLATGRN